MVIAYSELSHILERHVGNKALDGKTGENTLSEIWGTISTGFPFYGLSPVLVVIGVVVLVSLLIFWNMVGKGEGSHAGREEPRRAYRRELARQMAREDAKKIEKGEKTRRKWMQW